ncbi:tetratricopeptide repeat protein [Halorussus salinus]|uniref:tetratricopeptide repeat protein n=1 Tax=Halorussus salinus TaxID=1364935 RepID=UPI0010919DED|nr:tetratricopeptide repeat protein [Halorussus salinus]
MDIGTALRATPLLFNEGADRLRDDLAPHITAAVEQTAHDHADALAADIPKTTQSAHLPPFVDDKELPPEETGVFVITVLLYEVLESETLESQLDNFETLGESIATDLIADELEEHADESLSLDYTAVAADFCRYLERELSSDPDLSRKHIIRLLQQLLERASGDSQFDVFTEQGFDWIDDAYIRNRTVDPEYCWRRAFTFSELNEGYAIDRDWPGEEYTTVTDRLLADLADGGGTVLVSPPGAGKTTTTRATAIEWYNRHPDGVILYHKGGDPITDPDRLIAAIQQLAADMPVLVVVEDAARQSVVPFYEVLDALEPADNVCFLLNSREREWKQFDDHAKHHDAFDTDSQNYQDVLTTRTRYPTRRDLSALTESEIEQFIDQFESVADRRVEANPDELVGQIHTQHGASPMLLLSYHLPIGGVEAMPDDEASALEANVAETFTHITTQDASDYDEVSDAKLFEHVSLLANLLNAAEIPVHRELLYVIGDDEETFRAIDEIRTALDSWLFFGMDSDDQPLTHHPVWSELYLQHYLDTATVESIARDQFESVLNALFRFLEDADRREAIERYLGRPTQRLRAHNNHSETLSNWFVRAVFEIGEARPRLTPLFGTMEYSGLSLPDNCSQTATANCTLSRYQMHRKQGHPDIATQELEAFRDLSASGSEGEADSIYYNAKGNLAHVVGDFATARDYLERSLAIERKLNNHAGVARSLGNLGNIARDQGDFEAAREYYEQSLTIQRDLGNRAGVARGLGNLALVARNQGDLEEARDYHKQSLSIERDLGNRAGEAKNLGNLGLVAFERGDLEKARDYHEQSLTIKRDLGNRASEAKSLSNLGNVAFKQDDFEAAREYYQQSLTIERNLGNRAGVARTLNNLAGVATKEGDYEAGRDYYEQSLAISRDLDDRASEARSLSNLGIIAEKQDDFEGAVEYLEEGYAIFRELGAVRMELQTISNLIHTYLRAENEDAALEWCRKGIERCDSIDLPVEERAYKFRRNRAQLVETPERTFELYNYALDTILDDNASQAVQLLQAIWERRDTFEPDDDIYPVILGAGVGVAAHLVSVDTDSDIDPEDVLEEIEPDDDQLAEAARVLYEYLHTETVETAPAEFIKQARELVEQRREVDEEEFGLDELEALAYAKLLQAVQAVV